MWSGMPRTWTCSSHARLCSLQHNCYHPTNCTLRWADGHDRITADGGGVGSASWWKHFKVLRLLPSACPSSCPITQSKWVGSFFSSSARMPVHYPFVTYFLLWATCDITFQWFYLIERTGYRERLMEGRLYTLFTWVYFTGYQVGVKEKNLNSKKE